MLFIWLLFSEYFKEGNSFKFTSKLYKNTITRKEKISMAVDIPYIPALIGTAGLVFAIFNIENPVDLTDAGKAKAKAKRRAEKLARGESIQPKEGI